MPNVEVGKLLFIEETKKLSLELDWKLLLDKLGPDVVNKLLSKVNIADLLFRKGGSSD